QQRSVAENFSNNWTVSYGEQHSQTWANSDTLSQQESRSKAIITTDARQIGGSVTDTDTVSNLVGRTTADQWAFADSGNTEWSWLLKTADERERHIDVANGKTTQLNRAVNLQDGSSSSFGGGGSALISLAAGGQGGAGAGLGPNLGQLILPSLNLGA